MNVELVAQMFKNYQSNVLFHLEGMTEPVPSSCLQRSNVSLATENLKPPA